MHYLIDGHNLIGTGQLPGIALSDPDDEERLIALLHRFVLRHPRHRVTVVFDGGIYGTGRASSPERVEAIFARSPTDADERLATLLRQSAGKQGLTLVSFDQAVRRVAREAGIPVCLPTRFVAELERPARARRSRHAPKAEPKVPRAEVDDWLKMFGLDED